MELSESNAPLWPARASSLPVTPLGTGSQACQIPQGAWTPHFTKFTINLMKAGKP